jgi:hypothetical protein
VGELRGQKKTEQEEIAVDKELQQMRFDRYDIQNETNIIKAASNANDGFDPDEHEYDTVEVNKPTQGLPGRNTERTGRIERVNGTEQTSERRKDQTRLHRGHSI